MIKFIKQLFCKHDWYENDFTWVNDLIFGYYISVWVCNKCGKKEIHDD